MVISAVVLIVSFVGYGAEDVCASNKIIYRFMVVEIMAIVIMNMLILFAPFYWIQRYSNSPGNIAWVFLFFGYDWNSAYKSILIILGAITLLISLLTLLANAVAGLSGITTFVKRMVVGCWTLCLVLMVGE